MLIHLTPRYYNKYSDVLVDLIDVTIPELNLTLKSGVDLKVTTPFTNKLYNVVCRKKGRKAVNGIFIKTDKPLSDFTVITRWVVDAEVSTHQVHYHVMDSDFDAVTTEKIMWNGWRSMRHFKNRIESNMWERLSEKRQSSMLTLPEDLGAEVDETDWIYNERDEKGFIRHRTEQIEIPTVEPERLTLQLSPTRRIPATDDAFSAEVVVYPMTVKQGDNSQFGVAIVPLDDWIEEMRRENYLRDWGETMIIPVLEEIRERSPLFISNTNDLLNKANAFSKTFNSLSSQDREDVTEELQSVVFIVSYETPETVE